MSYQGTQLKPNSTLRFSGFNGEAYECIFYYDFQTEAALRLITMEKGPFLIDPGSVINDQKSNSKPNSI